MIELYNLKSSHRLHPWWPSVNSFSLETIFPHRAEAI